MNKKLDQAILLEPLSVKKYNDNPSHKNFTLIITHMNRLQFLERLLKSQPFTFNILIADASSTKIKKEVDDLVKRLLPNFQATIHCLFFDEGCDLISSISTAANYVTTKYASIIGDDDLINTSRLLHFVNLLENRSDVSVVIGKFLYFRTQNDLPFGRMSMIETTKMCKSSYLQEHFQDRFLAIGNSIPKDSALTTFGVMRSSLLAEAWNYPTRSRVPLRNKMGEVLASHISIAAGKVLVMDEIFCFRQIHSANLGNIGHLRYSTNQNAKMFKHNRGFEEWEALGVSKQFIGSGEQLANFIFSKYKVNSPPFIQMFYSMIWEKEIAQSISQEIHHEVIGDRQDSFWVKTKRKIHNYTFSTVNRSYLNTSIRKILTFIALRRYYLINFVKMSQEERRSLRILRDQLSSGRKRQIWTKIIFQNI